MPSDHPVFAAEIAYLRSVITPLRQAVSLAEGEGEPPKSFDELITLSVTGITGEFTVTGAVDAFLHKWSHGLSIIAEEAKGIADVLQVSLTDFEESESHQALRMRQLQRAQQAEEQARAASPVRSWLDDHGFEK